MMSFKEVIEDSIGGEERVLPGLGVLFEIIWQHSEANTQDTSLKHLRASLEIDNSPSLGAARAVLFIKNVYQNKPITPANSHLTFPKDSCYFP